MTAEGDGLQPMKIWDDRRKINGQIDWEILH